MPPYINKQLVACDNCGKEFGKSSKEINKTKHNFCCRVCFVVFNNKLIVRSKLPNRKSSCINCKSIISVKANTANKFVICDDCKSIPDITSKKVYLCTRCPNVISTIWTNKKYCNTCLIDVQKENGLKSVKIQSGNKRSKNEIYFAELCSKVFSNMTTNELLFQSKYGLWDADIILHDYKIAILWNGIWHYKKVRAKHSVAQVQARDKIKMDVIKDNGYIPYVVADYGKENKKFVESEFEKLKEFIINFVANGALVQ